LAIIRPDGPNFRFEAKRKKQISDFEVKNKIKKKQQQQ